MNEMVLYTINNDINYLMHTGRKGQKKGVFGASGATRWQSQAVYAKTTPNPNETKSSNRKRSMYGPYDLSDVKAGVSNIKSRVGDALAKSRAKQDAAVATVLKSPGQATKGARRIGLQQMGASLAGGVLGAAAGRDVAEIASKTLPIPNAANKSRLISPIKTVRGDWNTLKDVAGGFNKYASPESRMADIARFGKALASDNALRNDAFKSALGTLGSLYGARIGGDLAMGVHAGSALRSYKNRVKDKNFGKMSKSQIALYKKTYNDYLKKYAEGTKFNWGRTVNLNPDTLPIYIGPNINTDRSRYTPIIYKRSSKGAS